MTDHCPGRLCTVPSEEGCAAGEPDYRQCHKWQMGQLRDQFQKCREILTEVMIGDGALADVPDMLHTLRSVQQTVRLRAADAADVAISIRALEFLLETDPAPSDGQPDAADEAVGVGERVRADFLKSNHG